MSQDFNILIKYINDCAKNVNENLQKILPQLDESDQLSKLYEAMHYSTFSGGKRFRPFLLIATADLFSVPRNISIKYASIIELIHIYSLIHDDLPSLDNDDERRGLPSCHKKFNEATAILAGDALLTKAFQLASAKDHSMNVETQLLIINLIAEAASINGLLGGQFIDITFDNSSLNMESVMRMNAMKTGALFKVCCEIAVNLGNIVSKIHHHHITLYAKSIGAAFQIIDDIHDFSEDKKKLNSINIVNVIGMEKARNEAENLINQAIEMMSIFNQKKASPLVEFARYVYSRI